MPILHWLDKEKHIHAHKNTPYRILNPDSNLSHGESPTDNMIIQGDNLDALKSLLPYYAGRVKCIYIDPPYNTGNAFEHYDDNLEHSIWLGIMYPRLVLLRELLAEDGVIFVQIDDKQLHSLKIIMDEIFGRTNYETTFYIKVRHENRILRKDIPYQLVMEQVLLYKKSSFVPPRRQEPKKETSDYKYDIEILGVPTETVHIAGYDVDIYSPESYKVIETDGGSLKQYQIRGSLITQSGSASEYYEKNLRKRREKDGLGTLYKVRGMGVKGDGLGYRYIVQPQKESSKNGFYFQGKPVSKKISNGLPYQNFYDYESAFNRVGYEGEVEFKNGKKPESYIRFFLEFGSKKGDLVLDSFLGSGTTCAVAHKMGRRYIGIEMGDHAKTHCVPRMEKVIAGEEGGISKDLNWNGGGGFQFYTLGDPIFTPDGKINPNIKFKTLAHHIWFAETKTPLTTNTDTLLLGIHKNTAYILLYNGILGDKSVNGGNVLARNTLEIIKSTLPKQFTGEITVYGESCRLSQKTLTQEKINFKQTPYDVKV